LAEAKEKAHELYLEAQFRKKNKLTPNHTQRNWACNALCKRIKSI
jgi:hypothetical protein